MGTKKVRVLTAGYTEHQPGDVVEMDSATADSLIVAGAAEAAPSAEVGAYKDPEPVYPDPLPVRSGPYDPPEGAKEQLDVGEGGNTPPYEPLPVGSGPYEAPESAKEQLDVGEGGNNPPFEPLPVAPESQTVTPTDEQGQPNFDATEETEDTEPKLTYDDWTAAELRAAVKDRGLGSARSKKAMVKVLQEADAG